MELHQCGAVIRGDGADEGIGAIAQGYLLVSVCVSVHLRSGLRIHALEVDGIVNGCVESFVRGPQVFGPDPGPCRRRIGTPVPAGQDLGPYLSPALTSQDQRVTTAPSGESAQDDDSELRVVVGVDGSECGRRALVFAADEAAFRGALLEVVSVYGKTSYVMAWPVVPVGPDQVKAGVIVDEALAQVRELEPRVISKGEMRYGSAGRVLVDASRGAALLVLGSPGRSALLGPVSEHCVHHAVCPIALVR